MRLDPLPATRPELTGSAASARPARLDQRLELRVERSPGAESQRIGVGADQTYWQRQAMMTGASAFTL